MNMTDAREVMIERRRSTLVNADLTAFHRFNIYAIRTKRTFASWRTIVSLKSSVFLLRKQFN